MPPPVSEPMHQSPQPITLRQPKFDYNNKPPEKRIFKAIEENDLTRVLHLLENRVDVNTTNDRGETLLHAATKGNNPVLVALLLGKGAQVNIRDANGHTPLLVALEGNVSKEVQTLLANHTTNTHTMDLSQGQTHGGGKQHGPLVNWLSSLVSNHPNMLNSSMSSALPDPPYMNSNDFPLRTPVLSKEQQQQAKLLQDEITLQEYQAMWRPPPDSHIHAKSINAQLAPIFSHPPSQSIFHSHFARKSPITQMMKISHFRTIHNIFVSIFLVSALNAVLSNFLEYGRVVEWDLLSWTFADFPNAMLVWMGMYVASFSVYVIEYGVVHRWWSPRSAFGLYVASASVMLAVVPSYLRTRSYHPGTSSFVMCELLRFIMKMHSYVMVNHLLNKGRTIYDAKKKQLEQVSPKMKKQEEIKNSDHDQQQQPKQLSHSQLEQMVLQGTDPVVLEYPGNIRFMDFFRFLWFPTLVYQPSYPRTETVHWGFVFGRLTEFVLCIMGVCSIFTRFIMPYREEIAGDYTQLALGVFRVMLPSITILFLMFYMVLHSWFNAFAEITRFADRHFYSDWWNVTNWASYYRKWNYAVHHFIHRHVFMDSIVIFHMNKHMAMWLTFIVSAVFHEYIIAACLGFYKPILFILFVVPGVLFIYLTKLINNQRYNNIFFWSMMVIGNGLMLALYYRQWVFYQNDPNYGHSSFWSLVWVL